MRKTLFVFLIVFGFVSKSQACSPYGVPILSSQNVNGTNLELNWISTTAWSCSYKIYTEIYCSASATGTPLASGFSGCINKTSTANIAYASPQILDLSALCPGETYFIRAKEVSCTSTSTFGGSGWTGFTSFVYGTSGAFSVSATATSLSICLGSCTDLTALAINNCQPTVNYSWDNGAGSGATVNVCPASTTTYTVTATTNGICATLTATATVTIVVDTPPIPGTAVATPDHVCIGDVTNLSLNGYNGNIQWQSSSSSSGPWVNEVGGTAANYTTPPINSITYYQAEVSNACGAVYSNVITVFPEPYPVMDFLLNNECLYDPVVFTNNTSITSGNIISWLWDFGDGNTSNVQNPPAELYPIEGNYNVSLTATSDYNCVSNLVLPVVIHPVPVAVFSAADVCNYTSATFTDASTITGGSITGWNWDFDDGNTSILQNPTNLYANYGNYNPSLTVTSDMGCVNTVSNPLYIQEVPQANFDFLDVCEYNPGVFTDLTVMNSEPITWSWTFGDGNTSALQNPNNLYAMEGTYNVQLLVQSTNGCLDSISQQIVIHPKPVANFGVTDDCLYNSIVMTDASSVITGSVTGWDWDFGDGNTSTQQNTSNLYAIDGTYNVTLIATTDNGCTDTITQPTIVYPVPNVNFSMAPVCLYDSAVFTDLTTINAPGTLSSWLWDFGDNSPILANQNVTHFYPSEGSYNITLIVTSADGCVSQLAQPLTIYPIPVADFSNTTICVNTPPTSFTDISTLTFGSVDLWSWDFGDGNTSNLQNPTNAYGIDGNYNVQLTVTSDFGCIDDTIKPITVYEKPTAAFVPSSVDGCSPLTVTFSDNSNSATSNIISWDWDLGNGDVSASSNPITTYTNSSNTDDVYYDVELIVMNDLGCYDTLLEPNYIVVRPIPLADFYPDPESTNMYETGINMINTSIGGATYEWDLDDNAFSTDFEPLHFYSDTGTYYVTLITYSQYGCKDSTMNPVEITPVITVFVPNAFTPNGDGINDNFFFKGFGIIDNYFSFYIFNRWGELIYEAHDFLPWDGYYKGLLSETDVYVWKLKAKDVFGNFHTYTGHVTLLR